MKIPIIQVDAFTDTPFSGTPAAVCILPEGRDEGWMQDVAREVNLSETAFLQPREDGYNLRWFTPAAEVDLCGHATLAGAHVLWETGRLPLDVQARFHTLSGLLTAERKGNWIELDFPAEPSEPVPAPPGLAEALGATPRYVGKNRLDDYLVEIESEETVRTISPDLQLLESIPSRGFIVTSVAASGEHDFVSRFFAPSVGINEDPVTGSVHCCLGPFWGDRLGKSEMVGYQASERGGLVRVRLNGDRVLLGGQAVTVMTGELG